MDVIPVARRPFRVEPTRDLRRYFVTDATGRLVGHLEYERRGRRWRAFLRRVHAMDEPGPPGCWPVEFIGSFTGRYGQADAVTAMEQRLSAKRRKPES